MKKKIRSRRQMWGLAGAGLACMGMRTARASALLGNWSAPDLVVLNARVYTMDPKLPQTEAVAGKGDRVAALGTTKEIKGLVGRSTRIIDAQQMSVVPGFIDSHNHASGNTLLYEVLVGNPYDVEFTDIATIIDKLRAKAQKSPADPWIEGYFFEDTKLKDKRALIRTKLV